MTLQTAGQTEELLHGLLEQWGEALLHLQIDMPGQPSLDGGILCPCCKMIHGRCHEAAYPLLALARRTGRQEFIIAAKKVFRWGENMLFPDGSMRNDAKSDWRGITVFGAVALHDALYYHGDMLSKEEKAAWEARLSLMSDWLYKNLRPGALQAYINYYAAHACLMALVGKYFHKTDYTLRASELAEFCLSHTVEDRFLFGEGHPLDTLTPKGCRAADAGGYNVEETLPSLTRYAEILADTGMHERCRKLWKAHLMWMLPDGAWDDSVGSRAFKWAYWGSRTTDGCQDALFSLGRKEPVFAEAAFRNAWLYSRCTHGGLLYGGPDYERNGEAPCVHHTFCHAKALAGSLNGGLYAFDRTPLPSESAKAVIRVPELDMLRISFGGWIADISGYDHSSMPGSHASGGALSLLWHKKTGPLIAVGAADPRIKEPFNQQLPSDMNSHRRTCPRIELETESARYAQYYDLRSSISAREDADGVTARSDGSLCDENGCALREGGAYSLQYGFTDNALRIMGSADPAVSDRALFILPLIGESAKVTVSKGRLLEAPERFFNLNPGFAGREYKIGFDNDASFELVISV